MMSDDRMVSYFISLKNAKEEKKDLMRDVNAFFSPDDRVYSGRETLGYSASNSGELLDTTGTDLLKEYTSFVLGLFFDTEKRWFTMTTKDYQANENDAVTRTLEIYSDIIFECIGDSDYYAEGVNHDWDILVHGHALMVIDQHKKMIAKCRTKEPVNLYFSKSVDGDVDAFAWEEEYTLIELYAKFPEFAERIINKGISKTDFDTFFNDEMSLTPIINFYQKVDKDKMEAEEYEKFKKYKWVRRYFFDTSVFKNSKHQGVEVGEFDGFKEQTAFPARDKRTRLHPYGEGEGKKILYKARILNSLMRDMLNTSGIKADPPLVMSADIAREMGFLQKVKRLARIGTISKSKGAGYTDSHSLKRGSVYIASKEQMEDTRGRPVEVLNISGDIADTYTLYQAVREQVAELLPVAGQIYKVARQSIGELQQRTEEQIKRLAPIRANYVKEALSKHLMRFYSLAKKAGKFKDVPLPEGFDESKIKFVFDAFLLQSKRITDTLRLSQVHALTSQFMTIIPTMADNLDGDRIMRKAYKAYGLYGMLKDEQSVQAQRQQTQAEVQRRQQMERSAQINNNMLTTAKALQTFSGDE